MSVPERYLAVKYVADRFGVHPGSVWRWTKTIPGFPQPVSLSPGCTRWKLSDIEAWEAARANSVAA